MEEQKQWLAGVFDRAASTYDRVGEAYHEHYARRLVDLVGIAPGSAVLDVACGRGAVLLAAAGQAGSLTGFDVSPAMIALAAAELRAAGLDRCELRVMDAEHIEFPDASFDVLTAAFMLFFLTHPERAAAEFHRVLRPGGRIAVSTWGEADPRWAWEDDLIAAAGTPQRRTIQRPFDRAEDLVSLLSGADFVDLNVHQEKAAVRFATKEDWWAWHWSFSLRGLLEQFDEAAVVALRDASYEHMAELREADGAYTVQLDAWIITGRTAQPEESMQR